MAGRPSAQLQNIFHNYKVLGLKENREKSVRHPSNHTTAPQPILQPIKHFGQILPVERRRGRKKTVGGIKENAWEGAERELVASRQEDGRKDGENEEALQEAAGKLMEEVNLLEVGSVLGREGGRVDLKEGWRL